MVPVGNGAPAIPLHAGAAANGWNVPSGFRSATNILWARNSWICSAVAVLMPGTKPGGDGQTWSLHVQLTDAGALSEYSGAPLASLKLPIKENSVSAPAHEVMASGTQGPIVNVTGPLAPLVRLATASPVGCEILPAVSVIGTPNRPLPLPPPEISSVTVTESSPGDDSFRRKPWNAAL